MKRASIVALAAVGLCLGAAPAPAQEKVQLRFATVGIGSSWYNYGAGMADIVKPKLPPGSTIDVLPIAGGVGNVKLLQAGEAEIAFTFANSSAEGCSGTGVFKEKHDKLRAVLGGLDLYYFGTFVTRKSGIGSWEEIAQAKNKFRLQTVRVGGMGEQAVRQVLGLLGSSKDEMAKKGGFVDATERTAAAEAIKDGQIDGWAHIVTRGHPAATQIVTINDMAMLPLPDNIIKAMVEKHGWVEATIPANTFKGQTQPIKTVKTVTNLLAHVSLRDDVVYTITKSIIENAEKLPKIHAALSDFDPKRAADPGLNGNCPLHPGAARYYKEAGMLK